jgi:SAM-dependent methyltransferase
MPNTGKDSARSHEYELGHSDHELKRLGTQARLVEPMTRQFFRSAGLETGMRVLDVGSGAGHVSFLAAELVGPSGEVVGIDRSPAAVAAAQEGAKARSLSNISFRLGDPTALEFDRAFDAVLGRYVLMFSPDPALMLKGVAAHLRPGGIVVFHEAGCFGARSFPPAPLYDRCYELIVQTFRKVGSNPQMCLDLYPVFLAAGLPAPTMGLQSLIGGASSRLNGLDLIADLAITMTPVMEQMGVATAAELDPATLYARMHAEVEANGSVVVGRYEIGAWARLD